MKLRKYYPYIVFSLIVLLFSYFRLVIINSHNVAYTYDQGRDFLAGARIIVNKDPVFIGPTTGIGGLFHGAWWYYATAASFVVLGASPINYFYFLFGIHLATLVIWFLITKKIFGTPEALLSSFIITTSSYYVNSHTFAGNNILTIPAFAIFCLILVAIVFFARQKVSAKYVVALSMMLGLSAGFVAETELSFGIFLIPTLILLALVSKEVRMTIISKPLQLLAFVAGISIPFMPRILFEIKNGFMQTNILIGFFTKPKLYNPKSYGEVFIERFGGFRSYFEQSLGGQWLLMLALLVIVITTYLVIKNRKDSTIQKKEDDRASGSLSYVFNLSVLLIGLFVFSLVYRDPFWSNYYEGIQLGFLMLYMALISFIKSKSKVLYFGIITMTLLLLSPILVDRFVSTVNFKPAVTGMRLQESVVKYIVDKQKARNEKIFCARVYTPPVIPHTYDYLWFYHYENKDIDTPRYDFLNNRCWYIVEPEWKGYEFRLTNWKSVHIPTGTVKNKKVSTIIGDIQIFEMIEKSE